MTRHVFVSKRGRFDETMGRLIEDISGLLHCVLKHGAKAKDHYKGKRDKICAWLQ